MLLPLYTTMEEPMKTTCKILLLAIITVFITTGSLFAGLYLAGSGSYAQPLEDSAKYYEMGKAGYSLDLGVRYTSIPIGESILKDLQYDDERLLLLNYNVDYIQLKDETEEDYSITGDTTASIRGFFIGGYSVIHLLEDDFATFSGLVGGKMGGARLDVDRTTFNQLGGNTFTEIGGQNKETQYCRTHEFGFELQTFDLLGFRYTYDLVSVDQNFYVLHAVSNAVIVSVGGFVPIYVLSKVLPRSLVKTRAFKVVAALYEVALMTWWYNFDYDNHNWPFNDPEPLHYRRHNFAVSFTF